MNVKLLLVWSERIDRGLELRRKNEKIVFNKARWKELAGIHFKSSFNNVEKFKIHKNSLKSIELKELGEIKKKDILHLQCHFGLDSISLAEGGANVVGVDFSNNAIELAKGLSEELNIPTTFICSDIYNLMYQMSEDLYEHFDIVFTSYGTITWLDNLDKWAKTIEYYLKPGGFFYIIDSHPISFVLKDEGKIHKYEIEYSYFKKEPFQSSEDGSYVDRSLKINNKKNYQWIHTMGNIINSLVNVGLKIEFIHEFPFSYFQVFPFLRENDEGYWVDPNSEIKLPLLFSLKARKN